MLYKFTDITIIIIKLDVQPSKFIQPLCVAIHRECSSIIAVVETCFILAHRYKLKDDVRESLYDACTEWTSALRKTGRKFMGGDRPNLADLVIWSV